MRSHDKPDLNAFRAFRYQVTFFKNLLSSDGLSSKRRIGMAMAPDVLVAFAGHGSRRPSPSSPRNRGRRRGETNETPIRASVRLSRGAYELAYASQRETKYDRALRRARKLRLRLGGDPADDEYPDKPPRMRWATYNRLLDKLRAADGVADERLRRVLINAQMSGFGG
jgi:hypothetical protein